MAGNAFVRNLKALGKIRRVMVTLNAKTQPAKQLGVDEKEVRHLLSTAA
jgi:hypothetical protein